MKLEGENREMLFENFKNFEEYFAVEWVKHNKIPESKSRQETLKIQHTIYGAFPLFGLKCKNIFPWKFNIFFF